MGTYITIYHDRDETIAILGDKRETMMRIEELLKMGYTSLREKPTRAAPKNWGKHFMIFRGSHITPYFGETIKNFRL